jgi:hypothetical protein
MALPFRAWCGFSLPFSILFKIFSKMFTLPTSAGVRPTMVAMPLITMRALLVPPSDYGYSFTLSEYSGWKKLVHMLNASTNPLCVLFYYILCTYISYTILYYTTYAIYYIYIVVHYTKGWFIAAAESHKDPKRRRLQFVGSQGTEDRGWATQRTRQVTESRRRDDPALCIIIAVALHGQMYSILQADASSLMAAT